MKEQQEKKRRREEEEEKRTAGRKSGKTTTEGGEGFSSMSSALFSTSSTGSAASGGNAGDVSSSAVTGADFSSTSNTSSTAMTYVLEHSGSKPVWTVKQTWMASGGGEGKSSLNTAKGDARAAKRMEERNRTTYADGTTVVAFCNEAIVILEPDGGAWCWCQVKREFYLQLNPAIAQFKGLT